MQTCTNVRNKKRVAQPIVQLFSCSIHFSEYNNSSKTMRLPGNFTKKSHVVILPIEISNFLFSLNSG